MTNADKIRRMTDTELVDFLVAARDFPCKSCCSNLSKCLRNNAPEPDCKRHWMEWMREDA